MLLSFGPSSSYSLVPSFCKPFLRFVMCTNWCCSDSCVSNVDPSSSLSKLNSSFEICSQLPIFSVGPTCSFSGFCFSVSSMGFFSSFSCYLAKLFFREVIHDFQHIIVVSTSLFLVVDLLFLVLNFSSILSVTSDFILS